MRSTENPADAGAVFDAQVVPAAAARRARHAPGLPMAPDASASTYFVTRDRRTLARTDFEWPAVSSVEELRDRLRALWAGDPDLLGLIEPLLSLLRIPKAGTAPGGDVPDHIYPMY